MRKSGVFTLSLFATAAIGVIAFTHSGSDTAKAADHGEGRCIYLPLQGVHVINDHAIAMIDRDSNVAIAHMSGPCLAGKEHDLEMRMTSSAEALCSRNDIDTFINNNMESGQQIGHTNTAMPNMPNVGCNVTAYMYVGHMDKAGFLALTDDAKSTLGDAQSSASGSSSSESH